MMNLNFSFYDADSGRFTGELINVPANQVAINIGERSYIQGAFDHLSQRVEIVNGTPTVVDWQPPQPPDTDRETWSWNADTRRWVATPTLAARKAAAAAEIARQVTTAEAADLRPLRECVLAAIAGTAPPPEALARLEALEVAAAERREQIAAIAAADTEAALLGIDSPAAAV